MVQDIGLSIEGIKAVFTQEIKGIGGIVSDTFQDKSRLFLRALLPKIGEVGPQDRVQAGVALKVIASDIVVCPYVFRLVCANGAILAHFLDTQQVARSDGLSVFESETSLRAAILRSSAADIFTEAVEQLRLAGQVETHLTLSYMSHLGDLSRELERRVIDEVLKKGLKRTNRSRFGLMNTITALARDMTDPEARWTLEALGGKIGIPVRFARGPSGPGQQNTAQAEVVHVG